MDAIHLLNVLCKQKTYKSMIRHMDQEMKRFFGFKECGILFYSRRKDMLFTISENQTDEDEEIEAIVN